MSGCSNLLPILDDVSELASLRSCPAPLMLGVRERLAGNRDSSHPGNDRFGLTDAEIDTVLQQVQATPHQLVLYHAMIGSQIEDEAHFLNTLRESVAAYCRLRRRVPTLRYFNFGGGVPTSGYRLNFQFDYERFLRRLMECIRDTCAAFGVPQPDLIGEFGRYTVANHSMYLFEVGAVKRGDGQRPDWYLLNGSLMVTIPDMLLVDNQEFLVLPLDHWDRPVRPVRLAGRRTCDSDDVYPRLSQPPLYLPAVGKTLMVAVFGTGAYQQQISGMGGAHHCLSPEPTRIAFREEAGQLILHRTPEQDQATIMQRLGYTTPQPARLPRPPAVPLRQLQQLKAS
jgi:arginine decarboxylase